MNILQDNENELAMNNLKTEEQPLLASIPDTAHFTKPSSLLQKFVDTGDTIFKDAAGAAFNGIKTVASTVGNAALDLVSSHIHVDNTHVKDNSKDAPEDGSAHPTIPASSILTRIARNETGSIKGNAYMFTQPTYTNLGRALGKYQVTEGELNSHAAKYIGQKVTAAEFIASPKLQDLYMTGKIAALAKQGYTPEQIADIHRSGSTLSEPGDPEPLFRHPKYVTKFDNVLSER